jgi:TusA-related sulfurtransferase
MVDNRGYPMAEQVEQLYSFESNLEVCYEILLYLSSRLAKLKPGEALEFITGDPDAMEKIPAWVDARDYELLESGTTDNGKQRFVIRK